MGYNRSGETHILDAIEWKRANPSDDLLTALISYVRVAILHAKGRNASLWTTLAQVRTIICTLWAS